MTYSDGNHKIAANNICSICKHLPHLIYSCLCFNTRLCYRSKWIYQCSFTEFQQYTFRYRVQCTFLRYFRRNEHNEWNHIESVILFLFSLCIMWPSIVNSMPILVHSFWILFIIYLDSNKFQLITLLCFKTQERNSSSQQII